MIDTNKITRVQEKIDQLINRNANLDKLLGK